MITLILIILSWFILGLVGTLILLKLWLIHPKSNFKKEDLFWTFLLVLLGGITFIGSLYALVSGKYKHI
jgi:hypothetical protein